MHRLAVAALAWRRKALAEGSRRLAVAHALALVALVAAARLQGGLVGRGVAVAAALGQLLWPCAAASPTANGPPEGAVARAFGRVPIASELAVAAAVCAVTLPPWLGLTALTLGWPPAPAAWAALARPLFCLDTLLAAGGEEWFWRGYVQARLGRGAGAVACTSALFAACHWAHTGTPVALSTFVPSCVFGQVAKVRRHLLAATLVHAAYNLASSAVLAR